MTPKPKAVLAEVLATAEQSGELQRLALVGCALAELAWLQREDPPPYCATVYAMALTSGSPWEARRAGPLDEPSGLADRRRAAPDRRAVRAGDRRPLDRRRRHWAQLGCPYDEALALAESGDRELVLRALRQLTDLGASATVTRLTSQLVSLGGRCPDLAGRLPLPTRPD